MIDVHVTEVVTRLCIGRVCLLSTALLLSADEVIRKRLLVDGEGVSNDDRRINSLAKMVIKWLNTKDSAEEDRYDGTQTHVHF